MLTGFWKPRSALQGRQGLCEPHKKSEVQGLVIMLYYLEMPARTTQWVYEEAKVLFHEAALLWEILYLARGGPINCKSHARSIEPRVQLKAKCLWEPWRTTEARKTCHCMGSFLPLLNHGGNKHIEGFLRSYCDATIPCSNSVKHHTQF